ncbi:DUF3617 domain-containing protein [Desulfuromonas sp. AOP6]|uniref:DUF3617 domain-containing protein n=1 Tax=Desulfuromonas sp. AOP6 TaxID=1566351 RepID=UPI001274F24E|nr:DUF3617 domain-containing protein [Desulfuromonas sp. AOP6]BCA80972.1 hypothetical protein AOP6_2759 [Desulfuromonas sp. AOP6]
MFRTFATWFLVVGLSLGGLALAAEVQMRPGLWEISSRLEMPGMPMQMPAMTHTQCLSKEDLVPQRAESDQQCRLIENKVSGNTVRWVMQCTSDEGTTTARGEVTYQGDSFKGQVRIETVLPGQEPMEMVSHTTGKRIGDCP